jgi:MFS transporter, OPA family, sugar phosphate sensor protein UhpC
VLAALKSFFGTGPDRPPCSDDPAEVRRVYERRRWSVFLSVTFGYGFFYVARDSFSVVKDPLIKVRKLDPGEMGLIEAAFHVIYAAGRLTNGFLADRANIRRFMSCALLLSALLHWVLGLSGWGFYTCLLAWALNGWFQSVGSAPSVVALSQWFSRKERGTRYGIWSASHSIGEAITYAGTTTLVAWLGWRAGFVGPALVCGLVALVLLRTLADRPQTYGLPPVWQYRGEEPDPGPAARSVGSSQLEVLRHPAVWVLALASACMYVARYGMKSWGMLLLQQNKGYSLRAAGWTLAVYPIAEMLGSISSGFISDRFFGSRRNLPALLFGLLQVGALLALQAIPAGHELLDIAALAAFGYALGGLLVFLGGLMAVDLVPQRATGAAMGLIGIFSYGGAAVQSIISGFLTKGSLAGGGGYSVAPALRVWLGAAIVSVLLAALTWRARPRQRDDAPSR